MSDACVTDSFARAKEAWSGLIRSPYPDGAQAAGRIHPLKVCVTAAAVVNPGCALTDFNAEEAAGWPCLMRVTSCPRDHVSSMSGVPRIATDLLQCQSRQPWASKRLMHRKRKPLRARIAAGAQPALHDVRHLQCV